METLRRVLWMKAKVNDDDRYNSFSLNCCNFCIQFLIVVAIFGLKITHVFSGDSKRGKHLRFFDFCFSILFNVCAYGYYVRT